MLISVWLGVNYYARFLIYNDKLQGILKLNLNMIKEDFLHYLWNFKLFDFSNLKGTNEERIILLNSGLLNVNAGPDFFNAHLKINDQLWAGNVEIHIKSSDWFVHHHEKDAAYDSVILHVVWDDDMPILRSDHTAIVTLCLKSYVSDELLSNYQKLFANKQTWINCESDILKVDEFTISNWKERLYLERLEQKSNVILQLLSESKNDWEAVLFKMLAKSFGLKVNGDGFLHLANSIDFSVIRKCQSTSLKMEALLFGQAHLLVKDYQDVYYQNLQEEYLFLQQKFNLTPIHQSELKFFRLRPTNFPTIRISQLANLYNLHQNLFSKLIGINDISNFYKLFQVATTEFWETHYSFSSESRKRKKKLTKSFIDLLLINTIIPLKFVYQKHLGKEDDSVILQLIKKIKSESNSILDKFEELKLPSENALESQALLQLKNEYCTKKRCLECAIGNRLLVNSSR